MPKYLCKLDASDTPSEIDAFDEEEAAEVFADSYFDGKTNSMILSFKDIEVLVDDVAYVVTIKAVPRFTASKKNG